MTSHEVSDQDLQGLVFDCDGTLVDTMPAYFESWTRLCEKFSLMLSEERFYSLAGMPVRDIIVMLIDESGQTGILDPDVVMASKSEFGKKAIEDIGTPAIDAVVSIVKAYKAKGYPIAVASSGSREHVHTSLRDQHIFDLFDAIVTCEDVERPKPFPDIFVLAAEKIKCDPTKCRGFEDGQFFSPTDRFSLAHHFQPFSSQVTSAWNRSVEREWKLLMFG
jgi:HAD superfamily hydrolase (TIGR01509 family)